jgi:hypothetical protein
MNNVVFYRFLSNHKDEVEFEDFKVDSIYDAEIQFFSLRRDYFFDVFKNFNIIVDKNDIDSVNDFTLMIGFDPTFKELFSLPSREDFNQIISQYKNKIKKIVFWEMDTDWTNWGKSEYDERKSKFNQYFIDNNIPYKIFSTAAKFRYDDSVSYFTGHNAMVLERLERDLRESGYYDIYDDYPKDKFFYATANTINPDRVHFYKFLSDNILWEKNNVALFSTHRRSEMGGGFNYSYVLENRGGGGLSDIDDSFTFYPRPFEDEEFYTMNYSVLSHFPRLKNTLFEMTFETMYESNENMITQTSEKTFKPFIHKKPFLIFSYNKIFEVLEEFGFKHFDYIFDGSYDVVTNPNDRLYDVLGEFKRICDMDVNYVSQIVTNNKHIQEHNYNAMLNLFKYWRDSLITEITYE